MLKPSAGMSPTANKNRGLVVPIPRQKNSSNPLNTKFLQQQAPVYISPKADDDEIQDSSMLIEPIASPGTNVKSLPCHQVNTMSLLKVPDHSTPQSLMMQHPVQMTTPGTLFMRGSPLSSSATSLHV